MAAPAKERVVSQDQPPAQKNEALDRADRRTWWWLALTSLWAPPTVFAIALVPYVTLIEEYTPAYVWAQPLIKAFGVLMLVWFFALLIARFAVKPFRRLRHLRHESRELTGELAKLQRRFGGKFDGPTREKLTVLVGSVREARVTRDADRLEAELKKLQEFADQSMKAWRRNVNLDFAIGFGKALLIALLIRTVIVEPFRIPSGSMIPTLQIGDQIFVNKFIYGVRIPWLNVVPFQIVRPPQRGDVIVFNNPVNTSYDFIKRVIGVPGDVVELHHEVVYINGQPQPRQLLDPSYLAWSDEGGEWQATHTFRYREVLDGHPHATLQSGQDSDIDEGPYVVPAGHVFVMGDNRDNSSDSRYSFGLSPRGPTAKPTFVPYGNIKGKAMVIWLALGHDGFLHQLFGGTGLRIDRLFLPVR